MFLSNSAEYLDPFSYPPRHWKNEFTIPEHRQCLLACDKGEDDALPTCG